MNGFYIMGVMEPFSRKLQRGVDHVHVFTYGLIDYFHYFDSIFKYTKMNMKNERLEIYNT